MTATVVAGRPAPGEVWDGRTARWRCLDSGMVVRLGDDNPGAGVPLEDAVAADGPLCPPARRLRLAAQCRREAHEEQCSPSCADPAESAQRVTVLLDRADAFEQVIV